MKTQKINILPLILWLMLLAGVTTGCNRFLDHDPDDRAQINSVEAARELAVSSYNGYSAVPLFEMRCDNTSDKGRLRNVYRRQQEDMYLFREYSSSTSQDSPEGFWRESYYAIAHSNQVLYDLKRFGLSTTEAENVRGEALMTKAYNAYMLAQLFTLPYDPQTATTDLGLPYPSEPESKLFQEYERGTLQTLYDQIVQDFEEGYKIIGSNYKAPKFHFTRQAAAAFGTRLYRTLGRWDRVIELAHDAFIGDPQLYTRKINQAGTKYLGTHAERKQIWGYETENCNFLIAVSTSSWVRSLSREKYGFTTTHMNYFKPRRGGYLFLGARPAFGIYGKEQARNIPKFFEHFQYTDLTLGTGFVNTQFVLLTGDEVLFNLAEAYTMKEEYQKARECLQLFVSNWMDGYDPAKTQYQVTEAKITNFYKDVIGNQPHLDPFFGIEIQDFNPFYTTTPLQESYLRACLDLKRLAFLQEGMRFLDNRQYRMDIVHNVISPDGSKEEYLVLRGTDKRYAMQLPANTVDYLQKNPGYETELPLISK